MRYVNVTSPGKESTYRVEFMKDGKSKHAFEVDSLDWPWVKKKIEYYETHGRVKPTTKENVKGVFGLIVLIAIVWGSYLISHMPSSPEKSGEVYPGFSRSESEHIRDVWDNRRH